MGIAVQWDNSEQTVIRWDFEQVWSWDELADSARVSSAMIASRDSTINVILNLAGTRSPFGKITAHHRSAFDYIPANLGNMVFVCRDEMDIAEMLMPFFPNYQVMKSLAQARKHIELQIA